jgi:RNA polymerase sigma factor (TIGR02999 family)
VGEITLILERARQGDAQAADELLGAVYEELRGVARAKLSRQPPGQSLQPTSLLHEAWLRLTSGETYEWETRKHFYAAAAQAMRHILVERARRKERVRHGGELERVPLEDIDIAAPAEDEQLLRVNEALEELARKAPEKAEVVNLRFFAGLDEKEIAETLGLSPRTVERYWAYAKAWLFDRISQSQK